VVTSVVSPIRNQARQFCAHQPAHAFGRRHRAAAPAGAGRG